MTTEEEPGLKLDEGNRQNFCRSKARTQRGLQHEDQEEELHICPLGWMCSFMLIYICMKEFCFIKKVVEIKCKPKQNQRRIENKAGKLASSTVP